MMRNRLRASPIAEPVTPIIRPIAFIARRRRSWNSGVSKRLRSMAMIRSSRTEFVCLSTIAESIDCCWFWTSPAALEIRLSPIISPRSVPTRPRSPPLPVARTAAMRSLVITSWAPVVIAVTICGARLARNRPGAASQTRRKDDPRTRGIRRTWRRSGGGSMRSPRPQKIKGAAVCASRARRRRCASASERCGS